QSHGGEGEGHGEQFRNAEQAHFGVGGFDQHDGAGDDQEFEQQPRHADHDAVQGPAGVEAQRQEGVDEQGHEQKLLEGSAPFDEAEVGAGILEDHGLMNHGEFEVGGRIVDGDAAGFGDEDEEHGGAGEHLRGSEEAESVAGGDAGDLGEAGGVGADGDG